jgi:hypothetical protein
MRLSTYKRAILYGFDQIGQSFPSGALFLQRAICSA